MVAGGLACLMVAPASAQSMVTLRPPTAAQMLLHPLGSLQIAQRVAPLNVNLTRFGESRPTGQTQFAIEKVIIAGAETAADNVQEPFARAQFIEMTQDEKIATPAFEPPGGSTPAAGVDGLTNADRGKHFGARGCRDPERELLAVRAQVEAEEAAALGLGGDDRVEPGPRRVIVAEAEYAAAVYAEQRVGADGPDLGEPGRQVLGAQRAGNRCVWGHLFVSVVRVSLALLFTLNPT